MRNWRVLTAVVAALLAVIAAVLAYRFLSDADDRARSDVELVPVLRAAAEIPRGTTGDDALARDLVERFEVPRNAVPVNAIEEADDLRGLVASGVLSARQFVTTDSFVAPGRVEGFSATLGEDRHAISLAVDDVRGVGGFVVPNDTVNVIVSAQISPVLSTGDSDLGGDLDVSAVLIPGVRVLAVGGTTVATVPDPDEEEGARAVETGIITLDVDGRQALQLAHATWTGAQVYLSLNPPGFDADEFSVPAEIVEAVNWFDQDLAVLTEVRRRIAELEGVPFPAP